MRNDLRYILAKTPDIGSEPGKPLVRLGELDTARGKELEYGLNRSGSARASISLKDEISDEFFIGAPRRGTIRRSIIVTRGNKDLWSGPIATLGGGVPSMKMNFAAVGWFEFLNYRELRRDINFIGINPTTGLSWNDAEIAFALLNEANTQDPFRPTPISKGVAIGSRQTRERKYTRGQKIGPLIHELSEIENGFDYEIDPINRQLNIYGAGSEKGLDRPNIHYGYRIGPNNLESADFAEDGLSIKNLVSAYGDQGIIPGQASDEYSMNAFGIFEDSSSLTNIKDTNILLAYAAAEVAINSLPRLVYTIIPLSWSENLQTFRIGDDFDIGDRGRFSVSEGAFSVAQQVIRFYGASISVNDNQSEKISKLEISPT